MSQSINNLPVGSLIKDTGTTAKYATGNPTMVWRVIGKNHDSTNSITLESRYLIPALAPANNAPTPMNFTEAQTPSVFASSVNFSSKFSAKLKSITKNYLTSSEGRSGSKYYTILTSNSKSGTVHVIGYTEASGNSLQAGHYLSPTVYTDGTQYTYYNQNGGGSWNNGNPAYPTEFIAGTVRDSASSDVRGIARAQYYFRYVETSQGTRTQTGFLANTNGLQSIFFESNLYYIAPLICVPNDIRVSDTTDSSGAYTVVWNTPPRISTPSTNLGDKTKAFSTTFQVADDEGDTVSATIKLDSTTIQTIASVTLGADNTIAIDATTFRNLTLGSHTISIIANDGTESVTKTISFQKVSGMGISGSDGDLGNKWIQPTITYQVYDDNDLQVDITEKIDGEIVKELEDAPLNTDITFDMSAFNVLTPETQHTLKIEAVNADESTATRTWTFTKLYQYLQFYTDTVETDIPAERIYVVLDYDKTNDPEIQVLVCNDAGGVEWHYEDATEDVLNGQPHTFHYTPAEGTEGVSVMVRLIKNENTERVYFNNIGFTFS